MSRQPRTPAFSPMAAAQVNRSMTTPSDAELISALEDVAETNDFPAVRRLAQQAASRLEGLVEEVGRLKDSSQDAVRSKGPTAFDTDRPVRRSWEVTVRVDGDEVLTIGVGEIDQWVAGEADIQEYASEVRQAGQHILAFIGDGEPTPCFLCGQMDCECWDDMGDADAPDGEAVGPSPLRPSADTLYEQKQGVTPTSARKGG
jgi:hypothetical protein